MHVKILEMDDAKKQCSNDHQWKASASFSTVSSSSSSLEISSEEEHIIAESSSSRMLRKAFIIAKEANENTNHDNQ
jgi:hypothetical protein